LLVEDLLSGDGQSFRVGGHIPAEMKADAHGINRRRLADLGNWLRHTHHSTDAGLLWVMVEDDLEPPKLFVDRMPRGSDR
jgi:uncharacterized protein with HEPN domain